MPGAAASCTSLYWLLLDWMELHPTMRFVSTAKVLANCKLKYYRISECIPMMLYCLMLANLQALAGPASPACMESSYHTM